MIVFHLSFFFSLLCFIFSIFKHITDIFRYSLLNEDVTHDRNLLYIVVKVTLMTDHIEVTHYVNFATSDIWTVMNYSDIYDVTIYSVIFVMLMGFISIIGNL
jgi:hypothetical protein